MRRFVTGVVGTGFVLGLFIAFGVALILRALPESVFLETPARAVLYAIQIPLGAVFVWLTWGLGRLFGQDAQTMLTWAVAGALSFDGLVLGFWPALYGQTGDARFWMAATLLWAFAWIVIAGQVMNRTNTARPFVRIPPPSAV